MVHTRQYVYDIEVHSINATDTGYTWTARVEAAFDAAGTGIPLHLPRTVEHYGATAGAALDSALEEAMVSLSDNNPDPN